MSYGEFAFCSKNKESHFWYGNLSTLPLHLPNDRAYYVGMDASSKEIGIYVTDKNFSFHFIGTVIRRGEDKHIFYEETRLFLKRLFLNKPEIALFVTEDVPPYNRGWALPVLAELKGFINSWRSSGDIPSLAEIPDRCWVKIMPSSWKSAVWDKSKGKGRFNKKVEIAKDLCDKFPELWYYFHRVRASSDYDGFDACGIVHGYLATHFSEDGKEKIAGTKDFYGHVRIFCRSFSVEELKENPSVVLEGFEIQQDMYPVEYMVMDTEKSFYANVRMAASKYPFCITTVDDVYNAIMLRWMFGIPLDGNQLALYILRDNIITEAQLRYLMQKFPYTEKVTW